jgi:threonine dehydratase
MTNDAHLPGAADVEAARTRIAPFVVRTPMIRSEWLSDVANADVWLKLEIVQVTGSFKARGAVNALARLKERQRSATTIVTASAGNHGLAVAWAARELGFEARVHIPATAPDAKRSPIVRFGAELVSASSYEAAEAQAHDDAARSGAIYVSPYNDADVIAGAGTVALEMFADDPNLDVVVAPLGGGGLLAGAGLVARARDIGGRRRLVVGAEPKASPVFSTALAAHAIVPVEIHETIADGLAGNLERGSRTYDLVRDLADHVVLVAESSIEQAMRGLVVRERLIVEGAGATGVGAILQRRPELEGRRVGVVLSGRNVDASVLRRVME